jgi:isochorismate synthase
VSEAWQREIVASNTSDPWQRLEEAADHADWFAWHDGVRGLTFLAWGALDRCQPRGPERFAAVRSWSLRIRKLFGEDHASDGAGLPLALGGFAFSERRGTPDGSATDRWCHWPDADFIVPEHLVARLPSGLTLQATVRPGADWTPPAPSSYAVPSAAEDAAMESREHYESLVRATVNKIAAGDLVKAVVARPASRRAGAGTRFDPVAVLRTLRSSHPRALCFAMGRGHEVFLGASPETLVSMQAGALTTQAVAGTTRADEDRDGLRLRASSKDDHEHALVVQSIESSLRPICHRMNVGSRRLVRAGDVHHLVTPIEASPRAETTLVDAIAALHPTAALCGTPRDAAAGWLAEREGFDRGWYGAPIGWIDREGDGVFAVAIRSALVGHRAATAFVGAGVVRGSSPRAEWDETEAKLGPVRRAIDGGTAEDGSDATAGEPATSRPRRLA